MCTIMFKSTTTKTLMSFINFIYLGVNLYILLVFIKILNMKKKSYSTKQKILRFIKYNLSIMLSSMFSPNHTQILEWPKIIFVLSVMGVLLYLLVTFG